MDDSARQTLASASLDALLAAIVGGLAMLPVKRWRAVAFEWRAVVAGLVVASGAYLISKTHLADLIAAREVLFRLVWPTALGAWLALFLGGWMSLQKALVRKLDREGSKALTVEIQNATIAPQLRDIDTRIADVRRELVADTTKAVEKLAEMIGTDRAEMTQQANTVAWLKRAVDLIHLELGKIPIRLKEDLDRVRGPEHFVTHNGVRSIRPPKFSTIAELSAELDAVKAIRDALVGDDMMTDERGAAIRIDIYFKRKTIKELNYAVAQVEGRLDVLPEPEFPPDWIEWGKHAQIQLWQAVSLSLDFDPNKLVGGYSGTAIIRKLRFMPPTLGIQRMNLFGERLALAELAMDAEFPPQVEMEYKRNNSVDLKTFARWAREKAQWPVPTQFTAWAPGML